MEVPVLRIARDCALLQWHDTSVMIRTPQRKTGAESSAIAFYTGKTSATYLRVPQAIVVHTHSTPPSSNLKTTHLPGSNQILVHPM